jgi:holliday junction DNA helicase RuvA
MIAGLHGVLVARSADSLVIEVGGVSFRVVAPSGTLSQAGAVGDTVKVFTHLHVREDALTLFGFQTPQERDLFHLLLSVTGVGPKVALSLLSAYPAETLKQAIATGDVDVLSRVPGIGKKTAARLALELKGKLEAGRPPFAPAGTAESELVAALSNLGYTTAEVQSALQALPAAAGQTIEERLRLALQYFAGRR